MDFISLHTVRRTLWENIQSWLLALLFFCSVSMAAQSGSVQFGVVLGHVQSITVNQEQANVAIVLQNVNELKNGKASNQADHLQIISTAKYEVKVAASSQLEGTTKSIPVNTVKVLPSLGAIGGTPTASIFLTDVALTTKQQTLVASKSGDVLRSFDIAYKISGGNAYLGKPAGMYSTTITYSILPN